MSHYFPRFPTPLFRLRSHHSWCSRVPSSSESLRPLLLMIRRLGNAVLKTLVLLVNMHIYLMVSAEVSTLISLLLYPRKRLLTKILFSLMHMNSKPLLILKCKRGDILGRFQWRKLRSYSVLFNRLRSLSFQNLDAPVVFASFRTIPSHIHHQTFTLILPSICALIQTISLVPGALFTWLHSSLVVFHRVHKSLLEMSLKLIIQSRCILHSGLVQWTGYLTTAFPLILVLALELVLQQGLMVALLMQVWIFFDREAFIRKKPWAI